MKTILFALFSLFLMLAVLPAHAADLDSAKQQQQIGETDTGYIAAVGGGGAEIQNLIESVNNKRRAYYQKLANKNHVSLASIEELAGQKAIAKTAGGQMVRIAGDWSIK
ncbi:MAG: hypothetical protein ACI8P9_001250 [Parasphingorhabdus sp.]|jgi:uncharacterized protein YdbL (DUF1318 family)